MKKIITYSLWGNNQFYTVNGIYNTTLAEKYFPDWICRFYVAPTVPKGILEDLSSRSNVELIYMNKDESWNGMFWRFYAASDPSVDIMISRDTDSHLDERDKATVDEWLNSDKNFHIIRDNRAHCTRIMGGMWGARNGVISNIKDMIDQYHIKESNNRKNIDQEFLAQKVYPLVKNKAFIHSCIDFYGDRTKDLPIPRSKPYYEDTLNGGYNPDGSWWGDDNNFIGRLKTPPKEFCEAYQDAKYKE